MLLSILFLIIGLILILGGANFLTDGASAIAKRMGISELIVGLTVVAFGTSAPELTVSVISAIEGSSELAVGNVVGSNILNILIIIGITALIMPMKIERGIMVNEIPLVILSSIVILVIANSTLLDDTSENIISRVDGIVLLLFFAIFMRYIFAQAKSSPQPDSITEGENNSHEMPLWKAVIYVLGGLAALIYGGDRFVAGASDIALALGVSEAVIGLTIVAAGTSLPELATSITAAIKGKPGIAIGNVIGSNIFNIFFILGTSAAITPLKMGGITNFDLLTLIGASLLFWLFGWFFKERTITRIEGAILFICYISYVAVLLIIQ